MFSGLKTKTNSLSTVKQLSISQLTNMIFETQQRLQNNKRTYSRVFLL